MIRPALILAVLAIPTAATTENDPQAGPIQHREYAALMAPVTVAANRATAMRQPNARRPARQMQEANYQIAIRAGERIGVPANVTAFILDKESGGRADARNPKSTATGLGQIIKGTHEAIIGRRLTMGEHVALARDPEHNARLTAAHIRACIDLMPGADAAAIWRRCHYRGHASVGGRVEMARAYFRPDANGWLDRGTVAMPWAVERGA